MQEDLHVFGFEVQPVVGFILDSAVSVIDHRHDFDVEIEAREGIEEEELKDNIVESGGRPACEGPIDDRVVQSQSKVRHSPHYDR